MNEAEIMQPDDMTDTTDNDVVNINDSSVPSDTGVDTAANDSSGKAQGDIGSLNFDLAGDNTPNITTFSDGGGGSDGNFGRLEGDGGYPESVIF